MKKINIILSLICVLAISSCEGFLDVTPTNQADSTTSITSAADAQVMINGLMQKMTSSSYYGRNFVQYGDAKGGDITIYTAGFDDNMYYFAHRAEGGSQIGFWTTGYNCLLQANNLVVNLEKLKEEGLTGLDNLLGQALTIRALIHFDLVRLYGKPYNMDGGASYGVPVVTAPVDATAQLQRNTVKEVYDQVVADLTKAAPFLSKSKSNGYLNYYGNQAILGKVYMYMDNFSAALTCFKNIIDSKAYTLYTPANWVASWKTQFGSESIFEFAMYPNEGDLGASSLGVRYSRKNHAHSNAYGYFMASTYWKNIMGANDIRWGIMTYDHMKDEEERSNWDDCCYKYLGDSNLAGDGKSTHTAVNIKVIRLSEIYLLAAECALKSDKGAAANYLNAISKRDPDRAEWTASTINEDAVYNEYRRELLTEGKLFFEQMRQNRKVTFEDDAWGFGTTSQYRDKTIDRTFFRAILPIGIDEINSNPDIYQNPGY
ncbi:MAG: RagB/SusD family nutrient uptake outer membrane protein [Bacteroidales bacterium]|nr:RagB/SusD family nutrient uptake outer membrane protein [Bacteroidales bacterium]